jgi:hypothetical protein
MVSLEMLGYTSPAQNYPLPAMRRLYGEKRVRPVLVGSRNHPWRQHGDSALNVTLLLWTREPRRQYKSVSDLNFRIEPLLHERGTPSERALNEVGR